METTQEYVRGLWERQHKGKPIPKPLTVREIRAKRCPECGGRFHREATGVWRCDGLIDAKNGGDSLEACPAVFLDGYLFENG